MKIRKPIAIAGIGVSVLLLASCSDDTTEETPTTSAPVVEETTEAPSTPSAEPSASEAPSEEPTDEAPQASGDVTPPGTTLSTSEDFTAPLVAIDFEKEEGDEGYYTDIPATYHFVDLREGTPDDLADSFGQDDLDRMADFEIYYLDYEVAIPEGSIGETSYLSSVVELDAIDSANNSASGGLIFFNGGPAVCEGADSMRLEDTGSTPACQILLAGKDQSIESLEFKGDTFAGRSSDYEYEPIIWTVG